MYNRAPIPLSRFTKPNGDPLSNGYLLLELSSDASNSLVQICAGSVVRLELDGSGTIIGSPTLVPNSILNPSDTVYLLSAYTAQGEVVYEGIPLTVLAGFGLAFGISFGS